MRLRTTYRQAGAPRYLQPGGAWDVPTLDALLSSPRDATGLRSVTSTAAGGFSEKDLGRWARCRGVLG